MKKIVFSLLLMLSAGSYADYNVSYFADHISEWARYGTADDDPTHAVRVGVLAGYVQATLSHITSDLVDEELRICDDAIYKTTVPDNVTTFVDYANQHRDEWDKDMKQMVWLSMLYKHGPANNCTR